MAQLTSRPIAQRRDFWSSFRTLTSLRVPVGWLQVAIVYLILCASVAADRVDPDYWWHLAVGERVLDSGIPRHDSFSWTVAGHTWVAHEWLAEAAIAFIDRTMGYWGNIFFFDAVMVGALVLMYALGARLGGRSFVLTLLTILVVAIMLSFLTVRPQVFTWLFFAVFLYVLSEGYSMRVRLVALPLLTALWANLHLGFIYGLVVLGIFLVAQIVEHLRGEPAHLRDAALLLLLCAAAASANPHGPALLWYPLTYADDRKALSFIVEWQSPLTAPRLTFLPYYLAASLLLVSSPELFRRSSFRFLVAMGALLASFAAVRNVPFVALILVPFVGPAFVRAGVAHVTRIPLSIAAAVVAVTGALIFIGAIRSTGVGVSAIGEPRTELYPKDGVDYIERDLPSARLFNQYEWGGYVMHSAPGVRVFIDGRSDLYGGNFIENWASIAKAEDGWQARLNEYGVDTVLIATNSPLASALRGDPGWREVFRGEVESVIVRTD